MINATIELVAKHSWLIGLMGLSLGFGGGFLLIFSQSRYPGPGASYTTRKGTHIYIDYHLSPTRSRIGAILLAAGFFLQIVSYVVPRLH